MKWLIPLCLGLVCLFSFGETSLVVSKECKSGPKYWCGSIRNAKECKAVKHCIQTVWEKQNLPEDNDNVCSICKEMVKEARDQLLSNETQDEIKQVFVRSCMLIPVKEIVKECIKLAYEFIPELIDTLASQMNPLAVCSTAGLCNNPYVDRLLIEYEAKNTDMVVKKGVASAESCLDCKNFIKDVSKTVRTHSRSDVLDHLLTICGRLSSLSEGCMALVQDNFQMIYDFLSTGLHPVEVCDLFGMCPRFHGDTTVIMPKTGDEPCDFCVAVVNSWRNNLIANTTKDEFKMILNGLCHQTGKFENECLSLVDQYFEVLYDVLISEIDPKDICKMLGLCGPNSVFNSKVPVWTTLQIRPEDHLPLVPLRPSFDEDNLIGLDEANSYKEEHFLPRVSLRKSSVSVITAGKTGVIKVETSKGEQCIMCEFVLHFLQNVLNDKKTRDEIEQEVENVCKLFPHTISEQCQDYIEAYGDQLIQLLILQIDPSTICPMLKLCPGSGLEVTVNTKPTCVLCEFVMTELDQILEDKNNSESIKKAVDQVCYQLPKSIRKQCVAFVNIYVDQIIDLLVHDFTPAQICAQLGLCPGNKISPLPAPEEAQLPARRLFVNLPTAVTYEKRGKKVKQSPQCILCEFIIAKLDALLINGATAKEIEEAVDTVCDLLPSTIKDNCLSFMKEYGNSIIEMLVSHIAPKFVCSQIQLCRPHIPAGLVKATVKFPNDRCKVCEVLVDWVNDSLTIKDSEDAIVKIFRGVCDQIPGETPKDMCIDMTLKYGTFLPKLLKELKETKLVCQSIKECPLGRPKELLGSKKCTWGPSYWCKSKKHADSCGATQHCIEKVWLDGIPAA
ncbi:UNVERIFIED_CONTAM: hypothetical protein RMT77_001880 [Armadillidium vulgare]